MVEPKLISKAGVPAALEKATRYRLLNEPLQAESICRDILTVEPENQQALITLLLAVTDQFDKELAGTFVHMLNPHLPRCRAIQRRYDSCTLVLLLSSPHLILPMH